MYIQPSSRSFEIEEKGSKNNHIWGFLVQEKKKKSLSCFCIVISVALSKQ